MLLILLIFYDNLDQTADKTQIYSVKKNRNKVHVMPVWPVTKHFHDNTINDIKLSVNRDLAKTHWGNNYMSTL